MRVRRDTVRSCDAGDGMEGIGLGWIDHGSYSAMVTKTYADTNLCA